MRIFLTLLLILLSIFELNAQKNIIKLKHEKLIIPGQNFYIKEVIDGRKNKENIGFVQVGAFNKKVIANFADGLENEFRDYFLNSQTIFSNFEPIILRVTYLDIYEKTTFRELGRAEIKLEFYKIDNGKVGKIFETEAFEEEYAADVTRGHERRIRKVLTQCLIEFAQSQWDNIEPEWIALNELKEEISDVEQTAYSIDKRIISAPWADLTNIHISTGLNTNGFHVQYFGYADTIRVKQWFIPVSYTLSFIEVKPASIKNNEYRSMSSYKGCILIPFMNKINDRFYLSIQGGIGLGFESLHDFEYNVKNRFIFDAISNQFIMIIPKRDFGLNLGIGTYEYFVTSKISKWDIGLKFIFGFKF